MSQKWTRELLDKLVASSDRGTSPIYGLIAEAYREGRIDDTVDLIMYLESRSPAAEEIAKARVEIVEPSYMAGMERAIEQIKKINPGVELNLKVSIDRNKITELERGIYEPVIWMAELQPAGEK